MLGFAVTTVPVVVLNPVAGLQPKVVAPLAVNTVELPAQMFMSGETVTVGSGLITTAVVFDVEVWPSRVAVTL